MFSNQNSTQKTAIERLNDGNGNVLVNDVAVYCCYISGYFTDFFSSEEDAIKHCKENGCEFNGQWIQSTYSVYKPGELCCIDGNESVYATEDRSRYLDSILGKWQVPFVGWISNN